MPMALLLLLLCSALPIGADSGSTVPNQHGQWRTDAPPTALPKTTAPPVAQRDAGSLSPEAFEADFLRGNSANIAAFSIENVKKLWSLPPRFA